MLEIGIRAGGFIFFSLQEHRNRLSVKKRGTYRILCLGESTTGFGGRNSYPRQLENILNQRGKEIQFSVINKGSPGADTIRIVAQLENNLNKYNPNMVITMMGINDSYDSKAYDDIANQRNTPFLKDFRIYKLGKFLHRRIINKAKEKEVALFETSESEKNIVLQLNNHLDEQENILKKVVENNPKSHDAYCQLAEYYWEREEFDKSDEIFKKAIEVNPDNHLAYVEVAMHYFESGEHDKAKEILKKAIEISPDGLDAYLKLIEYYSFWQQNEKAKELFKKAFIDKGSRGGDNIFKRAVEQDPANPKAYIKLGEYYMDIEENEKAEKVFKKAIALNSSQAYWAYVELGSYYRMKGMYDQAEEILKKAIEVNPESHWVFDELLAVLYEKQVKNKLAMTDLRKSNDWNPEYYNTVTQYNYQRLKEIVTSRGIKLVVMQYPLRNLEPLKKMFKDTRDVIFIDNEKVFKKALAQSDYGEYFYDQFGGDFGHCTAKGNRLLAGNITDVILKKIF